MGTKHFVFGLLYSDCGCNFGATKYYYISPTGEGIDPKSQSDRDMYKEALTNEDLWVVQMFDADPKFPQPGLTDGNFLDFPGSFDTCLKAGSGTFRGKYYLLGLWTLNISDVQPQPQSILAPVTVDSLSRFLLRIFYLFS